MTVSNVSTKTLCANLQMTVSSKILTNNGLYPQKVSASRVLHKERTLPHQRLINNGPYSCQWFDSYPTILSTMKMAECLYCDVGPLSHLTCHVSLHRVHLSYIQSYKSYIIYSYIPYIHDIYTFMHIQHAYNIVHTSLH